MRVGAVITGIQSIQAEMRRIGTLPSRALAAAAVEVEDYAEGEAARHNRSGRLVRSLTRRQDGAAWVIGHDGQHAPHALFVHWGSRPHRIEPRRKKVLRFPAGGAFAFSRGVNHPGYKGDPYFVRAAAQAPSLFERQLRAMLNSPAKP